ncbi:hypothetical protein JAAARDRAFT_144381 [Jaapia argillacea MUCL 33604]|uniref:Uncharacterized protein n=1 Tax=Jaapia argillacea MUCL 33604 TaxID=933084 RepID=A0A067QCT8_9AGAM|nr:hypothetical protein JAAARDRAFT_144381 [Jaapia argillacea MUCL 33604]
MLALTSRIRSRSPGAPSTDTDPSSSGTSGRSSHGSSSSRSSSFWGIIRPSTSTSSTSLQQEFTSEELYDEDEALVGRAEAPRPTPSSSSSPSGPSAPIVADPLNPWGPQTTATRRPPPAAGPSSSSAPPSYYASTFPTSYNIGSKPTGRLLVSPDQLIAHLRLLAHFRTLKEKVLQDGRLKECVEDENKRWYWFVNLAVERFERWVCSLTELSGAKPIDLWVEEECPPVDILMVWHTYLLNPSRHAEDTIRLPQLKHLHTIFHTLIDVSTFVENWPKFRPSSNRLKSWLAQTQTNFDPFKAATELTHKGLVCPNCCKETETPFINSIGTGYAQRDFFLKCPSCGFRMSKSSLAASKFAAELARAEFDLEEDSNTYLAGTLHTPSNPEDRAHARQLTSNILSRLPILSGLRSGKVGTIAKRKRAIIEALGYSIHSAREVLGNAEVGEQLLETILMAYTDDRPFSLDLVGAVVRQGSFIAKMNELGWLETAKFDLQEDGETMPYAVARYHAFLDLMATSPTEYFVPTLDIDLAWHTHMLTPWQYASDCMEFVGRHVDHEDKVDNIQLSSAFDETCRAWKARYNVPYMHCGCPLPGDTLGLRLSKRVNTALTKISATAQIRSYLQPPTNPTIYAATHPSDHNAVYAIIPSSSSSSGGDGLPFRRRSGEDWSKRKIKVADRRERDVKMVKKGKMSEEVLVRAEGHALAFEVVVDMDCDRKDEIGLAAAGNFSA